MPNERTMPDKVRRRTSGVDGVGAKLVAKPGAADQKLLTGLDLALACGAGLLAVLLYLNTLHGAFVYDDLKQIVGNPLIQQPKLFWQALLSDVWAFKGGVGAEASSNYWRPSFVLWLIGHMRLFGLNDTTPWHATNIALHVLSTVLAYFLLRRLRMARPLAGAVALLFAAHPAHVETVAWISGSPDLILAACLLGSMWFVLSLRERPTVLRWVAAVLFYAIAQGAKEVAIFYPLIVFVLIWAPRGEGAAMPWGTSARQAAATALVFLVVGVAYFFVRASIIGQVSRNITGGAGIEGTILTAPATFAFYLRQVVFPYWIGPSYPLRPVTSATLGPLNFGLPLIVSLAAVLSMWVMARRSFHSRLGMVLFLLMLAPAMNIAAFIPEQLVHDRYLYLPLLGALIVLVRAGAGFAERHWPGRWAAGGIVPATAALACVPLGAQTFLYNRAWTDELALWERAIQTDPNSALNHMQFGFELKQRKRFDEALLAFERSVAIHPFPNAAMGRAEVLTSVGRFGEAEQVLRSALSVADGQPAALRRQIIERLAVCYERQRRPEEAATVLREGRSAMPEFHAVLTAQLSIVLYQSGRKAEALGELEAARDHARTEILPGSKEVFYRLGLLYVEQGRTVEARSALTEFLAQTTSLPSAAESGARGWGTLEVIGVERQDAEQKLKMLPP